MMGRIPIDGITGGVPILNGQQAAHIIDQLNRSRGTVMNCIAATMSDVDLRAFAESLSGTL